jgi:hypothetical protein
MIQPFHNVVTYLHLFCCFKTQGLPHQDQEELVASAGDGDTIER